jgi:hypothetical protein
VAIGYVSGSILMFVFSEPVDGGETASFDSSKVGSF